MRGKRYFIYSLFLVILIPTFFMFLMNSGCGSAGGGAVYFETVELSANCEFTSLDSDVALWEDTDADEVCDYFLREPDSVEIKIQSQSFENTSIPPSEVRIEKVRIDYNPMDDSPGLASRDLTLGQFVKPDSTHTLEIMLINQEQKRTFPLNELRKGEVNCHKTYRYNITLTFTGIETATNKQGNFSTNLTVQVTDFLSVDDNEPICDLYKLIATCDTTTLDSDVALWKWEDPNYDRSCYISQVGEDDSVEITIEAKSYLKKEFINIEGIIVDYTSMGDAPHLNSYSDPNLNFIVEPNEIVPFLVPIISKDQKSTFPLVNLRRVVGQIFESEIYEYTVKISFYGTDIATYRQYNFSINIAVQVSDFTDKDICTWE